MVLGEYVIIKQGAFPMPSSNAPGLVPDEVVMPDCCNVGVVFRTLLAVNATAFIGILLQSRSFSQGVQDFVEMSLVVELSCLWSLLGLCILRRLLERYGGMRAV